MMSYLLHEKINKAIWWDRAARNQGTSLQELHCTEHLVMVAGSIRDINIFPLSSCIVFTKLFVKLLDTLMQGMVTAAWAKSLVFVVASQFWNKVETRLDVINVFPLSKFLLFYGFDILFVLFVVLFSCLDSKFLLVFNCHLTFFFTLFTFWSVSFSLLSFLIPVLFLVFTFLNLFFFLVSQLSLLSLCHPLFCWKWKVCQWVHSSKTANIFFLSERDLICFDLWIHSSVFLSVHMSYISIHCSGIMRVMRGKCYNIFYINADSSTYTFTMFEGKC